jgi:hypothetical protein
MLKQDTIFSISDSSSVVTLSNTVFESLKWNMVLVGLKENAELLDGNTEIRFVEFIPVDPS